MERALRRAGMKQELAVVFLLDALEHARGAVRVYRAVLDCASDRERRRLFTQALAAAENDVAALEQVCAALEVSPQHPTAAREIVKDASEAMVKQTASALAEADEATAEAIACQCAALTEARSLANMEVLARIGPQLPESAAAAWNEAAAVMQDGIRERLAFAKATWRELLLRRIDVEPCRPVATPTDGDGDAAIAEA